MAEGKEIKGIRGGTVADLIKGIEEMYKVHIVSDISRAIENIKDACDWLDICQQVNALNAANTGGPVPMEAKQLAKTLSGVTPVLMETLNAVAKDII